MYFKITNKESELYKKLEAYIKKRRHQKNTNYNLIKEFLQVDFNQALCSSGGFLCLPSIKGIVPLSKKEIEGMKPDKQYPNVLFPNKRTKKGKEIDEFLNNLPNWWYKEEVILLPVRKTNSPSGIKFSTPYIEIIDETIIVRVDKCFQPYETEDFTEITETHFMKIYDQRK